MGIFTDDSTTKAFERAMDRHAVLSAKALAAFFLRTQLREAQRVPETWAVTTAWLPGNTTGLAVPVLSRNTKRSGYALFNMGTGTVLFSNSQFNVAEMKGKVNAGGVIQIGLLKPGIQANVNSTGPLFAASLTAKLGELCVIETIFSIKEAENSSKLAPEGAGQAGGKSGTFHGLHPDHVLQSVEKLF